MTATLTAPILAAPPADPEQRLDLFGIDWDQYVAITDAMGVQPGVKCVYLNGSLTLLTTSLGHEGFAPYFNQIIVAIVGGCDIACVPAGGTTFRIKAQGAGVQGDQVYYLGVDADRMRGVREVDLESQPPPNLAIEVEVTHPADEVMAIYGRLGVPEVWRFDARAGPLHFWARLDDGTYAEVMRSVSLPFVAPSDVLGQLRQVEQYGFSRWGVRLHAWVREVMIPRLGNGA